MVEKSVMQEYTTVFISITIWIGITAKAKENFQYLQDVSHMSYDKAYGSKYIDITC